MKEHRTFALLLAGGVVFMLSCVVLSDRTAAGTRALAVSATNPDLGSLFAAVGGDRVEIIVFGAGPQDPHYLEARPSFVKALHALWRSRKLTHPCSAKLTHLRGRGKWGATVDAGETAGAVSGMPVEGARVVVGRRWGS